MLEQHQTVFIERGSHWGTGYIESINGKPRDELMARKIFLLLKKYGLDEILVKRI